MSGMTQKRERLRFLKGQSLKEIKRSVMAKNRIFFFVCAVVVCMILVPQPGIEPMPLQ